MNNLAAIQHAFQDYLLAAQPGGSTAIAAAVREQYGLNAADRLAIYHRAYRARLREALATAFDKTWSYLGDELFAELADGYIAAHPSQTSNLRWYGAGFPAHLAETLPDHPVVAELARFEWTLGLAFDAEDRAPLSAAALQDIAPEAWGDLRFVTHPSVQQLPLAWNAPALWRALEDGEAPPEAQETGRIGHWLVWRHAGQPHFRSLTQQEAQALQSIAWGASFGEVCEQAGEDNMLALAGYLQTWLAQEVLSGIL